MEHPPANNDNSAEESTITKPSEDTFRSLLNADNDVTVDEEIAEDQEMEDSWVFVEADYHSYSDVASSVAEGSSSSCELPEREEEEDAHSKSDADKLEAQNGGVRKGFDKEPTKKETSNGEGSSGKNDAEDLPDVVKLLMRTDCVVTVPTLDLRDRFCKIEQRIVAEKARHARRIADNRIQEERED
ncbi:uncharacterized protein J4E78_006513 [Alternaria triticimaculans]|uniref:uncharacterized protein n=1 Tax=Alternaria triticimaculans TaxID=297637 RepID=UPI0020C3E9B2|nr:uncharacterized protein J4E78_006513 [Alternaria triticimaculans]KAI4656623.1 hypothetical protein J4E78_006513 [Alternaria triticimaculans]